MAQGTRYILAGGYDLERSGYAKRLREALVGRKCEHVLSCFFAKPEHKWLSSFRSFEALFNVAFPTATTELALRDTFLQQLGKADVLYLHGGETRRLKEYMQAYGDRGHIRTLLTGKTIIGSSAGANFLSSVWWSYNLRIAGKGTGITPLNTIVHYQSHMNDDDHRGPVDWDKAMQDVKKLAGSAAIITPIKEGELTVFDA